MNIRQIQKLLVFHKMLVREISMESVFKVLGCSTGVVIQMFTIYIYLLCFGKKSHFANQIKRRQIVAACSDGQVQLRLSTKWS